MLRVILRSIKAIVKGYNNLKLSLLIIKTSYRLFKTKCYINDILASYKTFKEAYKLLE